MKLITIQRNGHDIKICPICESVPLHYSRADNLKRYGNYCFLCKIWYNDETLELEPEKDYPPKTKCIFCCYEGANLSAYRDDKSIYWVCVDCLDKVYNFIDIDLTDKELKEYRDKVKEKQND